ncbi:MAG: BON domain-containing protein [Rhodospirillales bacterium]
MRGVRFAYVCAMLAAAAAPGLSACAIATSPAQERGFTGAVSDTAIRTEINALWINHNVKMASDVQLSVTEGRVLLTGKVDDPQHRVDAVRLAWQADGVREVINEIKVTETEAGLQEYARDSWITTRLRTELLMDGSVRSVNYSIDVVAGTVYLMGIARSQAELDRVLGHARRMPYVKQVVNYVLLKGDPRRRA